MAAKDPEHQPDGALGSGRDAVSGAVVVVEHLVEVAVGLPMAGWEGQERRSQPWGSRFFTQPAAWGFLAHLVARNNPRGSGAARRPLRWVY